MIRNWIADWLESLASWIREKKKPTYCFLCGELLDLEDTKWDGFRSNMPAHYGCDQACLARSDFINKEREREQQNGQSRYEKGQEDSQEV